MGRIFIIMAMAGEAQPLISKLDLKKHNEEYPVEIYADTREHLFLSLNGRDERHKIDLIGTQAATLNAYICCKQYKPELIINAGTAGALSASGLKIGDVVLSKKHFYFHDRRIPLPRYEEFGYGAIEALDTSPLATQLGLHQHTFTTGDSLDHTEKDLSIMHKHEATVKDMESAAIAWVCQLYQVPFFAVRSITDFVEHGNEKEFEQNFRLSVANLTESLIEIISSLKDDSFYREFINNSAIR